MHIEQALSKAVDIVCQNYTQRHNVIQILDASGIPEFNSGHPDGLIIVLTKNRKYFFAYNYSTTHGRITAAEFINSNKIM